MLKISNDQRKLLSNFEHLFATTAQAPGGVARLRELILTLAVQGKLVAQDASDEPASELLKKIRAEKDRLMAEGKIKKDKPLAEITEEEKPFELSMGWEWVRLGAIGDWGAGATPLRSNSSYYGGSIPWFKSGELVADYISDSEEKVTEKALRECSLRFNQVGDVLVAMYGATIGKTSILSVAGTTNQAVCACTSFGGFKNTYLLLLLKALKPYFISIGAGGAQPNISREKIIATVIGLPPLAEQSRIVARVEELMHLCDALEEKGRLEHTQHQQLLQAMLDSLTQTTDAAELARYWQRLAQHFDLLIDRPEAVDALEQTILQLAVRGLLVPQDRNDEPASELLKKIRAEKDRLIAEGKIKKDKPLPVIGEDEKPFELPVGWVLSCLGEIGVINPKVTAQDDAICSFVQMSSISVDFLEKHLSEDRRWRDIKKGFTQFSNGDVGLAKITPCFENGKSTVFEDVKNNAGAGTTELHIVRPLAGINPRYILAFLKNPAFLKNGESVMTGSAGQKRVPRSYFESAPLPLPPLAEQSRIVARVTELRALCQQLRDKLSQARTTQTQLAQAWVEQVAA